MPELPEVQTVVNTLEQLIVGKTIASVEVYYQPVLEKNSPYSFDMIINQSVNQLRRRGKYIIIQCGAYYLITHLRMEGKFFVYPDQTTRDKHTHCVIRFKDGSECHFNDTRKFGRMAVITDIDQYFIQKKLGLEPFSDEFTSPWLYEHLHRHKKSIKGCLLDQSIIAGIGNIYADEILFETKIHPLILSNKISKAQAQKLRDATQVILAQAIKQGGTTIRSFTSSHHVTGLFQIQLHAYGRINQPCVRCGTAMHRIRVAGRYSTFCPNCQRR